MTSLFDSGVRPYIDAYLLEQSEKIRDYGDYWSASSAGYCMRKNIFERLGVPTVSEDARKQRVFSSGHIFHEWIQTITKEAGVSVSQELELQDEDLMIRGHFDDLIKVNDNLIVYDYKTAHSKWFEYVKDRPMSHYNRMQLGTYMYMLRKGEYPELQEGRILKISKDDLRLHEIQLLWSKELEKEVYGYWATLNGYWKKKTMPECTCAKYEVNKKTGVGFMADKKYNPFFYNGQPCSLEWYELCKKEGKLK